MYPAICDGDQLIVEYFPEPISVEQLPTGQVVLCRQNREWSVHRVVEWSGGKRIKGDWAYAIDESDLAWGKVVAVNGRSKRICASPLIAALSTRLRKTDLMLVRKIKKFFFLLVVKFLGKL